MLIVTHTMARAPKESIDTLSDMTTVFSKALRLDSSRFSLQVFCIPNLLRDYNRKGAVTVTGNKELTMLLDAKLLRDYEALATTTAHEMVHVKQYAKGQLITKPRKNGKSPLNYWLGKLNKKDYYNRPWELEAFSKQQILANLVAN